MIPSPYHAGERQMQQKTGEEVAAYRNGRIIAPTLMAGAVKFIETQSFLIASSQDPKGHLWASVLSGAGGYVKVEDEKTIRLDPGLIHSNPDDCFWENIKRHPFAGLLFIDPATRRRYRVNGQISSKQGEVLLSVKQAYANCPKYIQRRRVTTGEKPFYGAAVGRGTALTGELAEWIKGADTFFVGSSNGREDMDASHRGGNPGFVRVTDPFTLRIPDYAGNSMYNTLGNFLLNAKAGLLFIDFAGYRTLQLTGTTQILWDDGPVAPGTGETGRHWTFRVAEWRVLENVKDTEWTFLEYSPFNPT